MGNESRDNFTGRNFNFTVGSTPRQGSGGGGGGGRGGVGGTLGARGGHNLATEQDTG